MLDINYISCRVSSTLLFGDQCSPLQDKFYPVLDINYISCRVRSTLLFGDQCSPLRDKLYPVLDIYYILQGKVYSAFRVYLDL